MKNYLAGDAQWRWPHLGDNAPQGVKLHLLTEGGVSVVGPWADDAGFVAWAPLIRITDKQAFDTAVRYQQGVRQFGRRFGDVYRSLVQMGVDPSVAIDDAKQQWHTEE